MKNHLTFSRYRDTSRNFSDIALPFTSLTCQQVNVSYRPIYFYFIFVSSNAPVPLNQQSSRNARLLKTHLAAWLRDSPSFSTLNIASAMVSGRQDLRGPRSRKRRLCTRLWLVFQHFCHMDCSWYW